MGSTKNVLPVYHAISGASMTGAVTSPVTNCQYLDNILIQLNFTGTPTGSFAVQFSADYKQDAMGNVSNAGNWIPLTLPTVPVATGAANQIAIDLNEMPGAYVRVVYTPTSGTGTLDMYITAKMI